MSDNITILDPLNPQHAELFAMLEKPSQSKGFHPALLKRFKDANVEAWDVTKEYAGRTDFTTIKSGLAQAAKKPEFEGIEVRHIPAFVSPNEDEVPSRGDIIGLFNRKLYLANRAKAAEEALAENEQEELSEAA